MWSGSWPGLFTRAVTRAVSSGFHRLAAISRGNRRRMVSAISERAGSTSGATSKGLGSLEKKICRKRMLSDLRVIFPRACSIELVSYPATA